jgi:FAD/FMN-containing dehydrogenase
MKPLRRRRWRNHTGNQQILPLRIHRPETLDRVRKIVGGAERARVTARAVGSHHSWSDAALTTGFVVETHGLHRVLEVDCVRRGVDTTHLVKVEAGMKLRELNAVLAARGLALANMGGYDEQTVAGVMATSTHGSGIEFGPICDFVRSVDVVAAGAECHRIEPTDGPTDPEQFEQLHPGWHLHQDDTWFDAVLVSIGCLGVTYAAVLEVRPAYWLNERRWLADWSDVEEELRRRDVLSKFRHYEVYINPHPTRPGGDHRCLITTREICDPLPGSAPEDRRHRQYLTQIGGDIPGFAWVLRQLFTRFPRWTPQLIDLALKGLVDEGYASESFRVLNIGSANHFPAISSEIGVPVDAEGTHIEAVRRVFETARQWRKEGNVYHSSPISLRFVRRSDALLSMMHGRDITMMMELILFYPTVGGLELLAAYEEALTDLGGRPHWGQVNSLAGNRDALRAMYPRLDDWLAVEEVLNASGVFDGPFSKRLGLTKWGVLPGGEPPLVDPEISEDDPPSG